MNIGKWVALAVGIGLIYLLAPILTPFLLGALLAYLADPLVTLLTRIHVPRTLGVMIVFLVIILLAVLVLFLLIPVVSEQISLFIQKVPGMINWVQQDFLPWLNRHFDLQAQISLGDIKQKLAANSDKVKDFAAALTHSIGSSTMAIIAFFSNLILVPVVTFYLLRDWPKVKSGLTNLIPPAKRARVIKLANDCDEVVGAFFKGQLLVMLGLAVVYSAGLWLIGLSVALFVGLLSGLVAIVPYLGFIVGIITASIAMYLETHQFSSVVLVWVVYMIGQACESMVFTPLFVGDKIGLHPVAVIFAVMAGGVLFGFVGVLIALPVSAVIVVLLKHVLTQPQAGKSTHNKSNEVSDTCS